MSFLPLLIVLDPDPPLVLVQPPLVIPTTPPSSLGKPRVPQLPMTVNVTVPMSIKMAKTNAVVQLVLLLGFKMVATSFGPLDEPSPNCLLP
jgi:hypothetical protein